jgi:hypothetical protein
MRTVAGARQRPGPLRRLIFRLPLLLDRLGWRGPERLMARLIGVEWIVLETRGRRSGRTHTVVLDIVGRDSARDVYYVQPAYGSRADWARNAMSAPSVARVGCRRAVVRLREATGSEGAEVVLRFVRGHPRYARLIVWFVGYVERIDRPDDELRRDLATTPVYALEVDPSPRARGDGNADRCGRPEGRPQ